MASSRKRVAAAANYDSGEDMPDLVVAGPSGGPALYLHPPVLQAERSSSESSEGQEEEEQVDASMSTMSCCKDNRQPLPATLLFTNSLDFRKMFRKMMFREDQKDDVQRRSER